MADSKQSPQQASPHVNEPCTPTGTPGSAIPNETTPTPLVIQQERPCTPIRLPMDPFMDANISPVSSLSSALTEIDGDIIREDSPVRSPSRINRTSNQIDDLTPPEVNYTVSAQTGLGEIVRDDSLVRSPPRINPASNHVVDLTAPELNYMVSAQTGLATVVHKVSPTRRRHSRTEWSNDQNRIVCERIQGLDRVLSKSVRETITQWHDLHPETKPPCAYTQSKRLPPSYKVFDRDGEEHEISEIKVVVQPRQSDPQSSPRRTLHYKTLILHSEDGPDELVTVINRRRSDREKRIAPFVYSSKTADRFLVVWLGPNEEFESEPCAVIVESGDGSRVKFRPDWFDHTPRTSLRKASPKKRPASRSPGIQPPENAVFSPELVETPLSCGRSPSSSPSKTPKTPYYVLSPGRADSNDLIKSPSGSRNLEVSAVVNRGIKHAATSPSNKQDSGSQLLICRRVSYEINCISGTYGALPWYLLEVLRQWHNAYSLHPPPCAVDWISHNASFQQGFSRGIHDRNGSPCDVFCFEALEHGNGPIRQRRQYHVLVLRKARDPDVLVRARDRIYLDNGQSYLVFLDPWLGLHAPPGVQACALKICDGGGPPTAFSPEMFDLASKHPRQHQHGVTGQYQVLTALTMHGEEGGNCRDSSMLPISFGGTSCENAPSQSPNISNENTLQNTAAPSATSPLSEIPQALSGQAQSHPDRRIQSARRLFGRERPMQSYIRKQLEEWHSDHGGTLPYHLLISEQNLNALIKCSVFDRAGIQREFSVFSVFVSSDASCNDQDLLEIPSDNSVSYSVVVLRTETEADKLVALAPPTIQKDDLRTQYLLAWHGATQQFEIEVCAIAVHWNIQDGRGPIFSTDMFDEAGSWPSSWVATMNESHSARTVTRTYDMDETGKGLEKLAAAIQSPRAEPEIRGPSSSPSGSQSPPKRKRKDSPEESGVWPRSADSIRQSPFINPGLRAKFISENSDSVRIFSLAGCDVETIFRKAGEFYKDRDPTQEFALVWKIPGIEGERYIWEGCRDEYDILCEDLRKLTPGDDAIHEIEIKLAGLKVKASVPDVDTTVLDLGIRGSGEVSFKG